MSYQEPVLGISKVYDYGTSKCYKVDCQCGSDDHSITMEVEKDDVLSDIQVHTYVTVSTSYWDEAVSLTGLVHKIENTTLFNIAYFWISMFNSLVRKVKLTYNIWIDGYVKFSTTTILTKNQARNFADTINYAIDSIEEKTK